MISNKWLRVMEQISASQDEIRKNGGVPWFRGHRDNNWKLLSTLHRYVNRLISESGNEAVGVGKEVLLRDIMKTLYRQYSSDAWSLLDARERSEWGILFSMQHFGLPTRLLDWTESFMCALYFAQLHRKPDETAALFVLNPQKLNFQSIGVETLIHLGMDSSDARLNVLSWHPAYSSSAKTLDTIAVFPVFTNARMIAQRSGFMLCGDSFESIEEHHAASDFIQKIELPPDTFNDIEAYLDFAGVNAFNYFPDLEGLKMKHEASTLKLIADAKRFYPNNA